MKKLFTLFFCAISLYALAQEPMPIPTDHTWRMGTEIHYGHFYENYTLEIVAQDTINDTIYHRVESIASICPLGNEGGVEPFLVRDEAGVWYRRSSALMPEELIFDFNAEVGDTLLIPSSEFDEYFNPYLVEVVAIGEIELPNEEIRNQWQVRYEYQPGWYITEFYIEGIGSRLSGLSTMSFNPTAHEVLTCLQNGSSQYIYWAYFESSADPYCCYYSGIDEYAKNRIEISPNPANNLLNIQLPYNSKWQLNIYNMQGALVKEETFNQLQHSMDIKQLPSGIYTVLCKDATGQMFAEKVVKH